MAWWQNPDFAGDLKDILSHVNAATDASKYAPATRICELYFHALNKLWTAFAQHQGAPSRRDIQSFIALLRSLSEGSRSSLLKGRALKILVDLTPEVLDHSVLKQYGYRPGQEITNAHREEATQRHRELRNVHRSFLKHNP